MRLSAPKLLIDINGIGGLDRHRRQERHGRDRRADAPRRGRALRRHRPARAADRARHAAHRPCRDPQSRHARRLDRLRRSGGRIAGLPAGARRRDRDRGPKRRAHGQGRRFLQGPVRDGARPARRADRDPRSGRDARTRASALPNSPAATATTPWSGSPPARRPTAKAWPTCGSPISASATRTAAIDRGHKKLPAVEIRKGLGRRDPCGDAQRPRDDETAGVLPDAWRSSSSRRRHAARALAAATLAP